MTYPDVWRQKLESIGKNLSLNAIGGPCTSYELVVHDQTEVAFCGGDIKTLAILKFETQMKEYIGKILNTVSTLVLQKIQI